MREAVGAGLTGILNPAMILYEDMSSLGQKQMRGMAGWPRGITWSFVCVFVCLALSGSERSALQCKDYDIVYATVR